MISVQATACTENQGFAYPVIVQYYRAAQTMISTSVPGVSVTPTAARANRARQGPCRVYGKDMISVQATACTENQGLPYPVIVQYYRAAQTMISTSVPGVSVTPTAARAGGLSASIHAIQALFISSLRPRSAR